MHLLFLPSTIETKDIVLKPDTTTIAMTSPFAVNNVRMYIAFRVFFNCRFYYPIFTVLFLDFGLTVAQFSILNVIWAATIVLAEVPSGALADIVGRRRLLVFAAACMVVEMAVLCLAPRGNVNALFLFFSVNRVLSGLAEAAASGADEAIAYDALQERKMADQWGRVLDMEMRMRSVAFIIAMTVGAAFYDPDLVTRVMAMFGSDRVVTQADTLRFPLYLTFVMSLFSMAAVLRLMETREKFPKHDIGGGTAGGSVWEAFKLTFASGRWILNTPFVLSVILFGMLLDGLLRMVITLASQYYRMVQLPESIFGVLGSVMALVGFFIPRLAHFIAQKRSATFCLVSTAAVALCGLAGMTFFWPYLGLVPALVAFSALSMVGFFVSYFINQNTESSRRATVLSFKGLAFNVSYGLIGMVYAWILALQKKGVDMASAQAVENMVFKETFVGFPLALMAGLFLVTGVLFVLRVYRR